MCAEVPARGIRNGAGLPLSSFYELERTGWQRAAPHYAACWGDTGLFVEALLDAAAVEAGTRLLDVACGPGLVSKAAAARGATPVGVDFAPAMVAAARERCPGLDFVVGDAQALQFADQTFGSVTMSFGILHLAEPERALAEARRVLVPGGRFAFSAWVAAGNAVAEIVDAALEAHAIPVELPEGPPVYRFSDPDVATRALVEAGFATDSVRIETETRVVRLPTADMLFEAELKAGVRTAAVLARQPPERLDRIRAAVVDGVRRHADGDGFALPVVARIVSASRTGDTTLLG